MKSYIIAIIMIIPLLSLSTVSNSRAADEPEVFRTYSLEVTLQPMDLSDPPPREQFYEVSYPRFIIPIVVAADEEFQSVSYWTPPNNYLNWKGAIQNIIDRINSDVNVKYIDRIFFKIIDWATWESDNTLTWDLDRIYEFADELNWNPSLRGKTVLIGFTGQKMEDYYGQDVYGCAFNPSVNKTRVALIHPEVYWADDNVVHHEISHLLGITYHCNEDDCVMSDRHTFVTILTSDGWAFWVGDWIAYTYLSHRWCSWCEWEIFHGQYSIIREYVVPGYGNIIPVWEESK